MLSTWTPAYSSPTRCPRGICRHSMGSGSFCGPPPFRRVSSHEPDPRSPPPPSGLKARETGPATSPRCRHGATDGIARLRCLAHATRARVAPPPGLPVMGGRFPPTGRGTALSRTPPSPRPAPAGAASRPYIMRHAAYVTPSECPQLGPDQDRRATSPSISARGPRRTRPPQPLPPSRGDAASQAPNRTWIRDVPQARSNPGFR